ncbi:MAG TPA: hypothetical protein VMT93_10340 [Gemmatimonadaceae bacterium]|nr:hypothetical protein [Gemmatimonadaceae bacterium]
MNRSLLLFAALLLAGCDLLPKPPRKSPAADTALAPLPGIRMDTMNRPTPADSARAAARAAAGPSPLTVHITGAERYAADSGFQLSCVVSESNGERLLQVEAIRRDARIGFTIYNGTDGAVPVGNIYTRARAHSRIGNFQVTVHSHDYADGTGRARITDPLGRSGTITAQNFIKMGAKKHESHRAHLSVTLRWTCE